MRRGFSHHRCITPTALALHTSITEFRQGMEVFLIMGVKRVRWNTMDKSQIPLSRLADQYLITCSTEGKTPATLRGYREKLGRFIRWCDEACMADFSVELVREYIAYLQAAPKYENHPFHQSHGAHMSAANVRNHVRVLRSFSSWLFRESFTQDNILSRLKVPKAPTKMLETLSDEEIRRLFACLDRDTTAGCRDAAMLLLFLDTGLRCAGVLVGQDRADL